MSDPPFVTSQVQLADGVVTYREAGSGFPVVMVAGLGLSGRFYEHSYGAFARSGLRLIVPNLPGTGGTPGPRTGVTADLVAAFLTEFATALHLDRAIYVGHSLGAQAVLLLAMRAPAIVTAIVLVGPTGGTDGWKLLHQAKGLLAESVRVRPGVIAAVAREYLRVSPVRYLGTWVKHRDAVAEGRMSEIDCPALLLTGSRDAVIDREYMELLRSALRDVTVVELAHASHALPRSQHEQFDAAVVSFAHRVLDSGQ